MGALPQLFRRRFLRLEAEPIGVNLNEPQERGHSGAARCRAHSSPTPGRGERDGEISSDARLRHRASPAATSLGAQMIRRIYDVEPLTCRCGAKMRILAFILDPKVVTKILRHIANRASTRERAPPSSALAW